MKMNKWLTALVLALVLCMGASVAMAAPVETFSDLKTAMEVTGGTVVLGADLDVGADTITVPAGLTVVLDLNGHTLSKSDAIGKDSPLLKNYGDLTIMDSSSKKTGEMRYGTSNPDTTTDPYPSYASNTISNYGIITIKSGKISNTTTAGGACYALDNYEGSTATISGGSLSARATTVRVFNWDKEKATLNVKGGSITSQVGYAINTNMGKTSNVTLNISGGTITTVDNVYNLAVYIVTDKDGTGTAKDLVVNVTGGTFNGAFALNGKASTTMSEGNVSISGGTMDEVICYDDPAYGFISGGSFGVDPDDSYIVPGEDAVKIGDRWYIGSSIPASAKSYSAPKTGDETNIALLVSLLALSAAAFVALSKKARFN